ncbi:hypothetical protein CR513_27301, partial [Mucuna pruriens]
MESVWPRWNRSGRDDFISAESSYDGLRSSRLNLQNKNKCIKSDSSTLQEFESDQPENVGAIGGYQYGKQPYQNRPFDNQQYGRQPFRLGPNQGPYIRTYTDCASRISRLPIAKSAISSTTFPTTVAIENATSRKFSISGGIDEATCSQQFGISTICKLQQHLANTMSHLQSAKSNNLPSQTIPNLRGNESAVMLRSGKELSQPAQHLPISTKAHSKSDANSQVQQEEKIVPLPFPTRTVLARKPESDEELLKMFRKVEIKIPLLDAIKQIPKYTKFLKELCVHKRKKMKGSVEVGGIVSALTRNGDFTAGVQLLPKKYRDPGIFSIPCTIGECTFTNAMLDLGASINVMPTSI